MDIFAENVTSFTPNNTPNQTEPFVGESFNMKIGKWLTSAFGFSLFGLGLPLNARVLWLMVRDRQRAMSSDMFTVNLTVMGVFLCLGSPLIWLHYYLSAKALSCVVYFIIGSIMVGQPLFQCSICVERYLAVVHPITYLKYKPVRYRVMCSITIWLIAVVLGGYALDHFPIYQISGICVVAIAVDLFCSVAILKVLRQSRPGDGERAGLNPMKRRAFITVLIILVITVVNYFPYPVVTIATLNGLLPNGSHKIYQAFSFALFLSGSFVHPLFYIVRNRKTECFWCTLKA